MTCAMRFMINNLLLTGINSLDVSSEVSLCHKENLTTDPRSQVFKFGGRFKIDSTNNKIYINDGSNKTATLVVGEYTYTTLTTQIQTQLNAVSSNFTVSYSLTTGKFSISRSSSFTLRLSQATNASWDTLGFSNNVDTVVASSISSDERRNHWPSEFIKIDAGYSAQVGFIAMIGALSKDFTISQSAVITLKGNTIDDFTSPIISESLSVSDLGVFKFFEQTPCRFFLIEIQDYSNPLGAEGIEIGNLYLGDYEQFDNRNIDKGFQSKQVDNSTLSRSESGQYFADKRPKTKAFQGMSADLLTPANKDFIMDIFQRFGLTDPFYVSIDPELHFSTKLETFTVYCKFASDVSHQHRISKYFGSAFELEEVL